jgi:hypothetical protein
MNRKLWRTFVVVVSFMLFASAGCAKNIKYSGFLQDYPELKEGPSGGAELVYIKEGVNFKSYNKIMLDHVVFFFSDDAEYKGINADEMKELSDYFHKAMVKELGDAYPLVKEHGPDVLRIRFAVTELTAGKPALNVITTVVPIGLAISIVKRMATGTHTFVGGASMEAELLDSWSNERLAVAIDTQSGKKYQVVKGAQKWGHAEAAFDFWAKRLRTWLDEVHGKK